MKKITTILAILTALLLVCSAALADTQTTVLTTSQATVTLTLKDGDTCDAPAQTSGSVVRFTARRPGCADITVCVALADLDGAQSLSDLPAATLSSIKEQILTDYPGGTITEHYTASGTLYLLVDANNDFDLHDMFTLFNGFSIDLIQYRPDFSDLTPADDAFLLDIMQGIWTR